MSDHRVRHPHLFEFGGCCSSKDPNLKAHAPWESNILSYYASILRKEIRQVRANDARKKTGPYLERNKDQEDGEQVEREEARTSPMMEFYLFGKQFEKQIALKW